MRDPRSCWCEGCIDGMKASGEDGRCGPCREASHGEYPSLQYALIHPVTGARFYLKDPRDKPKEISA